MGPGILPETTVGEHNQPYHLQMPTKALSCKEEAICEHGPEHGQMLIKKWLYQSKKVFYDQTSPNMIFLLEIMDTVSSRQRRGRYPSVLSAFSSKASISNHMGEHKCLRYGQLACFGRNYECWKVYKGFRATYALIQMTSILGLVYFGRTMQNYILQLLQQHGFIVEESGCWISLPTV